MKSVELAPTIRKLLPELLADEYLKVGEVAPLVQIAFTEPVATLLVVLALNGAFAAIPSVLHAFLLVALFVVHFGFGYQLPLLRCAAAIAMSALLNIGLGIRYPAAYCGLTGLKPTFGRSTMLGRSVDISVPAALVLPMAEAVGFGHRWIVDEQFLEKPPIITMTHAVRLPS